MVSEIPATPLEPPLTAAKDRIQIGPVPGWVDSCPFRIDFVAGRAGDSTYLLFDQQMNARLRQTYFHVALRLDTMQAVQDQSPWRLDFNPHHQRITLHSIKTWRGGAQFDHANLSSARIVDDQAAGSAPQGQMALLLMLEDIRPGDVLEWCYTVESRSLLSQEHFASFFALPTGAPVGKFHFSLLFNPARPMQWRSSEPEWQPVQKQNNGELLWVWNRDNYPGLPAEENTPGWHIAHPWIQISDWPDWGMVAAAFAEAWKEAENDPTVRKIAGEIAADTGGILEKADRTIQMVQDEYCHLTVHGELDGRPPTPPGMVARRRYGDCKDLSFLLVHLLKRLGVPARLVLVNTVLRKSIAEFLPAPGLFNHLLVEYQAGGQTHWVDPTRKGQGGSALNRVLGDYGAGLPIAGHSSQLSQPPASQGQSSVYELRESILLDTSGAWSRLAVVVAARGSHAEALRQELADEGFEAMAQKRLRLCADRFARAQRVGPMHYRDDSAANEFFLAEIFEIKDFLTLDPKSKSYKLALANDYAADLLKAPEAGPRLAPFALPHPCNIVHTIELHSVALPPAVVRQESLESDYLHFHRLRKTLAGYWTMQLTLSTLADAVPPESLDEHRKMIQKIRAQSAWSILVPAGDPRPDQRSDFGSLPESWDASLSIPASSKPRLSSGSRKSAAPVAAGSANGTAAPSPPAQPRASKLKWRTRSHRRRGTKRVVRRSIITACAMGLILIVILFLAAKNADHWWSVIKFQPPSPTAPLNAVPSQ
ncbi:MAG: DUF3857 domain-containing transglutaminase family protein [Limisphaerales bacterium]